MGTNRGGLVGGYLCVGITGRFLHNLREAG